MLFPHVLRALAKPCVLERMGQGESSATLKRFVNDPKEIVNDTLEGFLWANPGLSRLEAPGWVLVRSDWHRDVQGKHQVAVVTGGGSGHEPGDIGLIGKGMLTAVACGDVFAAPSAESLAEMLETVTGEAGCLVLVKNYTGNRLNFGMAVKRVTSGSKQLKVRAISVLDDIVPQLLEELQSPRSTRGMDQRSIAGTTLVAKIAGAAAEEGQSLESVCSEAQDAANAVCSLGVSFQGGSRPGARNPHPVAEDQLEVGLGIHGEPGPEQLRARANVTAKEIITKMVAELQKTIPSEGPLCVMLNNLGAVPINEMYILTREVMHSALGSRIQLFCGPSHFLTSLDANGISLSVLSLTDQREKYLLAPVSSTCSAWVQPLRPTVANVMRNPSSLVISPLGATPVSRAGSTPNLTSLVRMRSRMSCHTAKSGGGSSRNSRNGSVRRSPRDDESTGFTDQESAVNSVLERTCEVLRVYENELNELDGRIADGDTGRNLAAVAEAIAEALEDLALPLGEPGQLMWELAKFIRGGGGAMPAFLYIFVSNASEYFIECGINEWSRTSITAAFRQGLKAVQDVGRSKEGVCSFLDALLPALRAAEAGEDWQGIAREARKGARATEVMERGVGRAEYMSPVQLRGVADPGAMAVALVCTAIAAPAKGQFFMVADDAFRETLFHFHEPLGEGAFGTVYAASRRCENDDDEPEESHAPLAIKASRRGEESGLEEFGRLDVLDKQVLINWLFTDKPHIIKVHEVAVSPAHIYLVMERLQGPTLQKWLEGSDDIAEAKAVCILRQILRAVSNIHSNNMVHRDIKPENFMFADSEATDLRLIDIAGTMSFLVPGRRAEEVGTPAFMAPEELAHGEVTQSIDMWAVGVLSYFMLSGRVPYTGCTFAEFAEAQESGPADFSGEPWDSVSEEAIDFIKRCLILEPKDRLTVADALSHEWIAENLPPEEAPRHNLRVGRRLSNGHMFAPPCRFEVQSVVKTLFLIRHGEAEHNVLEKEAQQKAAAEAMAEGIKEGSKAYKDRLEQARVEILRTEQYRDAELSTKGRDMALHAKSEVNTLVDKHGYPEPTGVLVSPLRRTLETAAAIFPQHPSVHVRDLLRERQTGYACDERSFASEMQALPQFSFMSFNKLLTIDRRRSWYLTTMTEDKHELRSRSALLSELLRPLDADAIAIVSHKGFLRELERGPLKRGEDWPEFGNCEVRVYDVELMSDGRMSATLRYAPRCPAWKPTTSPPPSPAAAADGGTAPETAATAEAKEAPA